MPVPTHIFDPPFNIIRCSHAVLDVVDLNKSRAFYENTVGLHAEDSDDSAVYLRGSEEHQHQRVVLMLLAAAQVDRAVVAVLGMEADGVLVEGAALVEIDDVEHRVAAADDVERRIEDVCRNGHAVSSDLSFRGAKRTRNLEVPGSMLRIAPERRSFLDSQFLNLVR